MRSKHRLARRRTNPAGTLLSTRPTVLGIATPAEALGTAVGLTAAFFSSPRLAGLAFAGVAVHDLFGRRTGYGAFFGGVSALFFFSEQIRAALGQSRAIAINNT
jgi:hypothetical protein